jgi:hypothetical protein
MSSPGIRDASQWEEVVSKLRARYGDGISVVLVGSVARGRSTEESDIDFLVIGDRHLEAAFNLPRCHVQASSETDFIRNLALGEDFEAWSVRFGLPLYDSGPWARVVRSAEASVWPRWQAKIPHAARRLFMASALLKMGDADAATEETVYALCHVARALLLRAGIFPLSRPELAEQVEALGYSRLAQLHEEFRRPNGAPVSRVRLAQRYSKKLLLHLDRGAYAQCSKEYRERKRAKAHRRH